MCRLTDCLNVWSESTNIFCNVFYDHCSFVPTGPLQWQVAYFLSIVNTSSTPVLMMKEWMFGEEKTWRCLFGLDICSPRSRDPYIV